MLRECIMTGKLEPQVKASPKLTTYINKFFTVSRKMEFLSKYLLK